MNNTNTHIAVVLDRSGSMSSIAKEIIGGFNGFVEDQKAVPGTATMTLVQFDDSLDKLTDFKPLNEITPLTDKTYVPRGMTRLYDAIGLTVNSVKEAIEKTSEKPDKVLVVILTDGMENSSQEYTTEKIKSILEEQQKSGWEFTFIGANQDAILTARGIGLHHADSNISYAATAAGAGNIMRSLSASTTLYRTAKAGSSFCYSQADRDAQDTDPATATSFIAKATFNEQGSAAGASGGNARAASLTPKQRTVIARTAAKARWSKKSV